MPDEMNYQDIKAGVDGMVGDVPAPSAEEVPAAPEPSSEENSIPATNYSEGGYSSQTTNYGQQQNYGGNQIDMDRVHEIIEAIVNEKWQEIMAGVGNIAVWKEKTNNDVVSIKQELVRLEERFEQLQNAVLGRVKEYDEGVRGIHTEMKALEKVFERILEPLTSNIKELSAITQELKKSKR